MWVITDESSVMLMMIEYCSMHHLPIKIDPICFCPCSLYVYMLRLYKPSLWLNKFKYLPHWMFYVGYMVKTKMNILNMWITICLIWTNNTHWNCMSKLCDLGRNLTEIRSFTFLYNHDLRKIVFKHVWYDLNVVVALHAIHSLFYYLTNKK